MILSARIKALIIAVLMAVQSASSAFADGKADADEIVRLMVTKQQYMKALAANQKQIEADTRKKLSAFFDLSTISDADFAGYLSILNEEMVDGMVGGLRTLFFQKLTQEMSDKDLATLKMCLTGKVCTKNDYSKEGLEVLQSFGEFGRTEGERLGQEIGQKVGPRVIERVLENEGGRFENPENLAKALTTLAQKS